MLSILFFKLHPSCPLFSFEAKPLINMLKHVQYMNINCIWIVTPQHLCYSTTTVLQHK